MLVRVDSNYYAVDISKILGLTVDQMKNLISWAKENKALLVTQPSIVTIEANKKLRYTLGIGSLLSENKPPVDYLKISGTEWVDSCKIDSKESNIIFINGNEIKEGILISLDLKSTLSLVNGMKGKLRISLTDDKNAIPLIILKDNQGYLYNILFEIEGKYYLNADFYGIGSVINYIADLYLSCKFSN